jgi:uncharacterized membrane protein
MDLLLSLELGHAVASLIWLSGGAVLALILWPRAATTRPRCAPWPRPS